MPSETALAFGHLSARSEATADRPRDRISVRNHVVEVEIGAFQAERGVTQRVQFNVVVEVIGSDEPLDDDVDRILSYDRVTDAITYELAAERLNLLETLAERVADRILLEPQAVRAFVRIEKLDRGPGALGVEIVRSRKPRDVTEESAPQPNIVFVPADAIDADTLGQTLDDLTAGDAPLILCVDLDESRATAAHPLAQRRIDLLSIEQTAWRLAARDVRCIVVASRTELDWAMRQGQISVWAPSKIVLDATDAPQGTVDPQGLCLWLADLLDAQSTQTLGADLQPKPLTAT